MELTDHQIRCLLVCDAIRWNETEALNLYNWHLLRRQMGVGDAVVSFEWEQAGEFAMAYDYDPPPSPPPGPQRSPWLKQYGVSLERVLGMDATGPDLSDSSN